MEKFYKSNNITNSNRCKWNAKITTLKSNSYYYYPQTLTNSNDENATIGLATGSKAYNALFTDTSENICQYWLGSPDIFTDSNIASFGVRIVYFGCVDGYSRLFFSNGFTYNRGSAVRPAVSLKSDI